MAFVAGLLVGLSSQEASNALSRYQGAWRRSEIVTNTPHGNILMSDYGHHPTEVRLTLESIKKAYADKKLLVVFQPHQYSRTRLLLQDFMVSFFAADEVIIPNIYFSRDTDADVQLMPAELFVEELAKKHPSVLYGQGLSNTLELIKKWDAQNPNSGVIVLL